MVGKKIRAFREFRGYSQIQLAELSGINVPSHEQVTAAIKGMPFYFPTPYAPWERGANENTNGLIREYCPNLVDMVPF